MNKRKRLVVWTSLTAIGAVVAPTAVQAEVDAAYKTSKSSHAAAGAIVLAQAGGEGGEGGGEGGEGGIDPGLVGRDPVAYLTALDVIRAHYLAGAAAYAAGDHEAGAEMFAHPIGEVYVDLEPVLMTLGAKPFAAALDRTVAAAGEGAPLSEVEAAAGEVGAALDAAAGHAPGEAGLKAQAMTVAEMIDRAALQYRLAMAGGEAGEAYLDGYGFAQAAAARAEAIMAELKAKKPRAAEAAGAALATLNAAYPGIAPPASSAPEPGKVLAAASNAVLNMGSL